MKIVSLLNKLRRSIISADQTGEDLVISDLKKQVDFILQRIHKSNPKKKSTIR